MIFSATSALVLRLGHVSISQRTFSPPQRRSRANWYHHSPLLVPTNNGKAFCARVKVPDETNQVEEDEACEMVNGVDLVIGEGEDAIQAYLLTAVKNNNGSGLILLSDIFGFEDSSTRDFAYRVACNGYNVLLPDLFRGNPFKKDQPRSEFDNWIQTQDPLRVSRDIDLSTKWLMDEFKSAGILKKLGIIGFCYGGARLVETLARDENSNFATAVCFYGSRMDPSLSSKIRVPVLFVSGDKDPLCPVTVLEEMKEKINGAKMVVYEERGHGFIHRPETQEDDQDAENAFEIARTWLHDNLLVDDVSIVT